MAAGHALFWVSLRTRWLDPLFGDCMHLFGPGCDFFALYQAGAAALRGESLYTYAPERTLVPYGYPFRYLPLPAYFPGKGACRRPPRRTRYPGRRSDLIRGHGRGWTTTC